jgi:hypothetical protein
VANNIYTLLRSLFWGGGVFISNSKIRIGQNKDYDDVNKNTILKYKCHLSLSLEIIIEYLYEEV